MELEVQQPCHDTHHRGVAAGDQPAPTVNATPPLSSPQRLRIPTLYRWIDAPLKSGKASQHLVRQVKRAVEARAARCADPSADAASATVAVLPEVVRLDDIAAAGGTIAVVEQIQACVTAALQVMAHARHEDGKVRIPKVLLAASEHLRRSLETAARLQEAMFELAEVERFNAAIFKELRKESPELAERVVIRLQRLTSAWEAK